MSNVKDLRGIKFNTLTVTKLDKVVNYKAYWLCKCTCGNSIVRSSSYLNENKNRASCGCKNKSGNFTHGETKTPLYATWLAMRNRCRPNSSYRARGITVCTEWADFNTFKRDMGVAFKVGLSLDRKDNLKGYSKDNCRWVTPEEQRSHSSKVIRIQYKGNSITLKQASAMTGIKVATLRVRFKAGWTIDDIMNRPVVENSDLMQPLSHE